jgi:hypothetical protein
LTILKQDAYICDVDGTVANHTGIRGHYDYDKVSLDLPIKPIIDIVKYLDKEYYTVFVSGRPERARRDTIDWLTKHVIYPDELFMRPDYLKDDFGVVSDIKDHRFDYVVKLEIYINQIEPFYNIKFAIDDRPQVLKMWQSIGIPTLAVGTPWIDF